MSADHTDSSNAALERLASLLPPAERAILSALMGLPIKAGGHAAHP